MNTWSRARTLRELILEGAERDPDRPLFRFRDDQWTTARTVEEAQKAAFVLAEAGVRPKDRVVINVSEVDDALRALTGTWMLGATAVVVGSRARLSETAARVEARVCVVQDEDAGGAGKLSAKTLRENTRTTHAGESNADDVAIIQLSSGTTGRPKGVVLEHRAILANLEQMRRGLELTPDDSGAFWLPLHHDMGLIGGVVLTFYSRHVTNLISSSAFYQHPLSWLRMIAERRATTSPAPTSAYAICAKLAKRLKSRLDLSCWRRALIGAEAVVESVMDDFARAFEPHGFDRRAFLPVYGLAETTLAVTVCPIGRGLKIDRIDRTAFENQGRAVAKGDRSVVSVGAPLPEVEVAIIKDGVIAPERTIGEIHVRTPSRMRGYLGEPAREDRTVHTGDLGYLADGELYITGRDKELIIRGGRNLDPIELEAAAARAIGVRGAVAAGVPKASMGTELAVVIVETKSTDRAALEIAVKNEVLAAGLELDRLLIVGPGWIPRTTSGKRMRHVVKERLLAGELGPL